MLLWNIAISAVLESLTNLHYTEHHGPLLNIYANETGSFLLVHVLGDVNARAVSPLKKTKHGSLYTSRSCLCILSFRLCSLFTCMHVCRNLILFCECKHIYMPACLCFSAYAVVCLGHYSVTSHTHNSHCTQPYTLSPSVCIMFLAWPLFLFAGRAKAEPARQTTTKRRKRKNSASSANSSVGTTASKKRSPATNFSLSSQVPVSISSTRFASFFIFISLCTCMFAGLHTGIRHS